MTNFKVNLGVVSDEKERNFTKILKQWKNVTNDSGLSHIYWRCLKRDLPSTTSKRTNIFVRCLTILESLLKKKKFTRVKTSYFSFFNFIFIVIMPFYNILTCINIGNKCKYLIFSPNLKNLKNGTRVVYKKRDSLEPN